jgi:hypothetical protein
MQFLFHEWYAAIALFLYFYNWVTYLSMILKINQDEHNFSKQSNPG